MLIFLRPAVVLLSVFTVLTGLIYPLIMTGIAQIAFPRQANGSLVKRADQVTGSELIGQRFSSDRYFHGRPSAAGQDGYDAAGSSGSNLGPTSTKLIDRVKTDAASLQQAGAPVIPADAVTTSASGLDPHISPAFAGLQIARIATARSVPLERIQEIVTLQTEQPVVGVFGEPRVNVLRLNLALDAAFPKGAG